MINRIEPGWVTTDDALSRQWRERRRRRKVKEPRRPKQQEVEPEPNRPSEERFAIDVLA